MRNDGELLDLLAKGRAVPLIGATFDLSEAAAALRHVAEGRAVGKVLVRVAPGAAQGEARVTAPRSRRDPVRRAWLVSTSMSESDSRPYRTPAGAAARTDGGCR